MPSAREINDQVRYTMWSVFAAREPLPEDRSAMAVELDELVEQLAEKDVVVRGFYDVAGLRADADLLIWAHAETAEELQDFYARFRRTGGRSRAGAGVVADGPAPPSRVQQEPRACVPCRRARARLHLRVSLRPLVRVVLAARRGAPRAACRARSDGSRVPRCARQHGVLVRPRRLRVDPRLRSRRAAPDRGPDASLARVTRPADTCAKRCRSTRARRRSVAEAVASLP